MSIRFDRQVHRIRTVARRAPFAVCAPVTLFAAGHTGLPVTA
jgi:hypothetical protein